MGLVWVISAFHFSHDGKYIVCGSEDKNVYLWKTVVDTDMLSLSVRKDRNRRWESIRGKRFFCSAEYLILLLSYHF